MGWHGIAWPQRWDWREQPRADGGSGGFRVGGKRSGGGFTTARGSRSRAVKKKEKGKNYAPQIPLAVCPLLLCTAAYPPHSSAAQRTAPHPTQRESKLQCLTPTAPLPANGGRRQGPVRHVLVPKIICTARSLCLLAPCPRPPGAWVGVAELARDFASSRIDIAWTALTHTHTHNHMG